MPEGVRLLPRRASFTKGGLPHRFTSFQTRRGVLTSAVNLLYQGRASVVQVLRLLARRSRGRATTSVTEWHSAGGPSVSEAVGSGFLELAADRAVFVLRIGPEDSSARKSSEPVRARRSLQDATETVGKSQVVVVGVQGVAHSVLLLKPSVLKASCTASDPFFFFWRSTSCLELLSSRRPIKLLATNECQSGVLGSGQQCWPHLFT